MLWHGRDLRQYKRLLSPPLEVLLTCPGAGGSAAAAPSLHELGCHSKWWESCGRAAAAVAAGIGGLGRGLASLPVTALAEAGLASGLSTLAEDAVAVRQQQPWQQCCGSSHLHASQAQSRGRACAGTHIAALMLGPRIAARAQAAVESPFLESALPSASAVLCVLSLPARVTTHDFNMTPGALNDPEKYAIRAAVQVAAMTVADLAGRHCQEVVVCAHVRPDWPHTDPSLLCLEATLLVLEDPAAAEEGEQLGGSTGVRCLRVVRPAAACACLSASD